MKIKNNMGTPLLSYDKHKANRKLEECSAVIISGTVIGGVIGVLTFLPTSLCITAGIALGLYNVLVSK